MATHLTIETTGLSLGQSLEALTSHSIEADAAAAGSELSPGVDRFHNISSDFSYSSSSSKPDQTSEISAVYKLSPNPALREQVDKLWEEFENVMEKAKSKVRHILEEYGVGEGEEDSETEEGQIWRMVQGDAPYTLNLA
ncbi:hypothetical protein ACJMK2_029002 [Sinanodonta woodiana]|uniref:Uncharacterized protein n=1 Tax=Sinanodonta woodiana TaxID=1069815 RepID=A0ABD3X8V2_SINWO